MADNFADDFEEVGDLKSENRNGALLRAADGEAGEFLIERAKREDEGEVLKIKKKDGNNTAGQNGTIELSDEEDERDLHHFSPREEETDSDEEE